MREAGAGWSIRARVVPSSAGLSLEILGADLD
jgi:hypothetical protein